MRALVTGGTGFLGGRLSRRLHEDGWEVTATGRNIEAGALLQSEGIRFFQLDLRDHKRVIAACSGQDAIFHCGALSTPWGRYNQFFESNVLGTENVIAGCMLHEVSRLIHVSTPSVYFTNKERLYVKESDPLPRSYPQAYAQTKKMAELAVEKACLQGLPAVTIRPRAIFGPGDNAILPRLILANSTRGVPLIDGGNALIDLTYVDNVVDAMLLCQAASKNTIGRTYNISNGQPIPFIEALHMLFAKLEISLNAKRIPYKLAYAIAVAMETVSKLIPSNKEPKLTRSAVGMLGLSLTLDIEAARHDLGYEPRVTIEEGMAQFAQWWRSISCV